ncbi:hypothetical protein [Chryseobacterium taichungense]|uniref:hypothetical protein n=1 Tax=Chryseobacterium taichungense TaxID=295069 RepID=UPI0028AC6C3D|nr:hypothetical protein [Chryseobacterium taichungense]
MSNKTINEIREEIEILKKSLKNKIDEFAKENPGLELNIEIKKEQFHYVDASSDITYHPEIEVILK